ncbi:MAG TPA: hypothetical protein PLM56_11695 [Cyclobacteriaceae bacterium]|jgi:hypothetical protein|nr:hypothetical protein [Cytophagales bacterium]HNT50569.1 hypothetical protein [Cyclobacteriaceae bacterium]HRE68764.1 hypothetical protein [Cyclobacteriaceae bacterium]HRF34154.1 hypothetical protein [Cyclobacteriaceae bacterium]
MKFLNPNTPIRLFTVLALVWGALCFTSPIAKALDSCTADKQTFNLTFSDHNSQDIKPYVPVHRKNAASQPETELKAEEEDSTEKDNGELAFGLLFDFNSTWSNTPVCSGRTLVRLVNSTQLYILYHSWKLFLH